MTEDELCIWRISASEKCPRECICEMAPLKNAPFVLTWMTSWGEDSLPDVHANEVYEASTVVQSATAEDAEVDVDKIGLHATCSLHATTNMSILLSDIPSNTMVLTLMQAPGCNLTILDGGQLVNLNSLLALHIQGYAHRFRKQVSGYTPNRGLEVVAHQQLMEEEFNNSDDETRELSLAVAEDALESLTSLQLLDLQYVRLVASKDARRLRRYSLSPISSKTMVDLPLKDFMRLAGELDYFKLPPHMDYPLFADYHEQDYDNNEDISNHLAIENLHPILNIERTNEIDDYSEDYASNKLDTFVLPYKYYKQQMQPQLAPFRLLQKLKYLRVAHARLDKIGVELLQGLSSLHTLTLEHNKINLLPETMFDECPLLRHLSVAHNKLLTIKARVFRGLTKLLTLDTDYNKLSVIGSSSLPPLYSLTTLRVEGNPLKQVLPGAFRSLNSTQELYLGSTNVSLDIHEDTFKTLPSLMTLVLQNVSMNILQKNLLTGMPRLQELTLHGRIPHIYFDAFSATPSIQSLILSYLKLEKISMDAFFGLHNLQLLDISHNNLHSLSPGIFDHLINLRELYLSHNKLTTLPLGIFLPIPAKLIRVDGNPWNCTCDLLQLRPSITNKIKKTGSVVCRWDEKLATVCHKSKDKLIYNARVAPLCHEPVMFKGNDVYHVALKHLQCSKYHWDPTLLQTENTVSKPISKKKDKENQIEDENDTPEVTGWLPLMAFTPEPIPKKDLLEMAENDGLVEVMTTTKQPDLKRKTLSRIGFQQDQGTSHLKKRIKMFKPRSTIAQNRMRKIAMIRAAKNKLMKQKHLDKIMSRRRHEKAKLRARQKLLYQKRLSKTKKQRIRHPKLI